MSETLAELLRMEHEPVGVFYFDEKPQDAYELPSGKRNCVVSMMLMAAQGKPVVTYDENCACAGGAVGLGFGNAFERRGHPTRYLLSTGLADMPDDDRRTLPPHMVNGERFFCSPSVVDAWKEEIPYGDEQSRFVLFAPQSRWVEHRRPDAVVLLLNPDQLSAVVCMGSFRTGKAMQTIAPFSAACQSILRVRQDRNSADAPMVMGMFDIAQRHQLPANMLSLTMGHDRFDQLSEDAPTSCLSSQSWKKLVRLREQ